MQLLNVLLIQIFLYYWCVRRFLCSTLEGFCFVRRFDIPSAIPDGSIQRAGENVVALLREVGNSPLLADHQDEKFGKIVFFDLFGYMTIVFELSTANIANIVVAAACALTTLITTSSTNKGKLYKQTTDVYLC